MDNAPPPQADPPPQDAPAPPDRVERNLRALDRLTQLGMEQAEAIHLEVIEAARTAANGHAAADLGVKFTRIARSIGQTVALSTKIMNDAKAAANARPDIDRRRRAAIRAEEYRRKDRVRDTVEKSVRAHAHHRKVYDLLMELDDRLEYPALQPDLDVGRLGKIFQNICSDFGIEADFDDWSDEECGFVVPLPSETHIPDGVDPSGYFDREPPPSLDDIIGPEAAARRAEVEVNAARKAGPVAEAATPAEPTAQKIDPSPG